MSMDFTKPQANNRRFIKHVTDWVEDMLPDALDDYTVMVNEMKCFEPVSSQAYAPRFRGRSADVRVHVPHRRAAHLWRPL